MGVAQLSHAFEGMGSHRASMMVHFHTTNQSINLQRASTRSRLATTPATNYTKYTLATLAPRHSAQPSAALSVVIMPTAFLRHTEHVRLASSPD
jgi:hypothetical protein